MSLCANVCHQNREGISRVDSRYQSGSAEGSCFSGMFVLFHFFSTPQAVLLDFIFSDVTHSL